MNHEQWTIWKQYTIQSTLKKNHNEVNNSFNNRHNKVDNMKIWKWYKLHWLGRQWRQYINIVFLWTRNTILFSILKCFKQWSFNIVDNKHNIPSHEDFAVSKNQAAAALYFCLLFSERLVRLAVVLWKPVFLYALLACTPPLLPALGTGTPFLG